MVKYNYGANHSELRNIAKEMNEDFLQFCLFSETRFYQYAHRTYNHFSNMFHILFEKLLCDASKDTRKDERDANENIQNLLVQAELVINLLFMQDFSYLVTLCSKELQRFDVLPHYAMNVCKKLKQQLQHGMEWNLFKKGRLHLQFFLKREIILNNILFGEISIKTSLKLLMFKHIKM